MIKKHFLIAGGGLAAIAVLAGVLLSRNSSTVSADAQPAAQNQSFFSRLSAPRQEILTVPGGTRIAVRLEQGISTEKNNAGDTFGATLDGPLVANGKTLAPAGTKVTGLLTDVTEAGRVEGRASLTMTLRHVFVSNKDYTLSTQPLTLVARSTKKKDAAIIGGSAAAGALIGAIAGGGKGAAIGAGVGGGSGTGYVLATKGEPVAYGPETRFTFALTEPLDLPVYKK
jgi:hypothetical protein